MVASERENRDHPDCPSGTRRPITGRMMRRKISLLNVPVFRQKSTKGRKWETRLPAGRVGYADRRFKDGDPLPSRPDEDFHLELKTPGRHAQPGCLRQGIDRASRSGCRKGPAPRRHGPRNWKISGRSGSSRGHRRRTSPPVCRRRWDGAPGEWPGSDREYPAGRAVRRRRA